jgi:phenylacetate-CoA ligase
MSHGQAGIARRVTGYLGVFTRRRLRRRGYRESKAADRWSEDELRAYHDGRLAELVRFAAARIPFYRDLYARAGVDVARFGGTADLHHLPTITKADLLRHGEQMIRPGIPELRIARYTTGGSTGTIATLAGARGIASLEQGCIDALWDRVGVHRRDRMVTLRGALLDDGRALSQYDRAERRLTISTYHLNDGNVPQIVRLIDDYRPAWLHVYPSAATLLANILQRTGRRLSCPLRGVLCGSEAVYPWQVQLFAEVYGGRTYAHYGHGESALLGGWCENAQTYHFLPNHGYVELLDDQQQPISTPDVSGEITGTGYLNRVMPLIRYRTADYGAWDQPGGCPACGRHHQRLARIDGRIQEYLTLADGTRFPATNINALHGMFFALIYRFQFAQQQPGRALLRFVPAVEMTPERLAEIRAAFAYLPAMGLELEFQPVSEIPYTISGKQRVVVTS